MISARNLRQLSNGNKSLIIAIAGLLFLGGCDALRPAQGQSPSTTGKPAGSEPEMAEIQGTRVYDPVKQQWVVVPAAPKEKMDTLKYKIQPFYATAVTYFPNAFPPNRLAVPPAPVAPSPAKPGGFEPRIAKKPEGYKVIVGLPFMASESENAIEASHGRVGKWAVNFYAGMKLAGKVLESEGAKINVHVRDTRSDDSGMAALLASYEIKDADVFIGPYRRDNIRAAAEQAKANDFVLVSPYSAVTGLVTANPNYIQVNPSLEGHCKALVRHARGEFAPEDILVVYRANNAAEKTCAEYLQKSNAELEGSPQPTPLTEMTLTNSTYAGINIAPVIKGRPQLAVLIPSWADQNFVFFLLRRIAEAKTPEQRIVVYGMPQWMDFQNFEYEFFEKLNVRISSSAFTDPLDPDVKAFRMDYYNEYGTLPDMSAFEGYGLFLYIGRMLNEYGKYFQYFIDVNPQRQLHTRYEFQAMVEPDAGFNADRLNAISRFENTYLNILEFREYQFQVLR